MNREAKLTKIKLETRPAFSNLLTLPTLQAILAPESELRMSFPPTKSSSKTKGMARRREKGQAKMAPKAKKKVAR